MALPTLFIGAASMLGLYAVFRSHLRGSVSSRSELDPSLALLDRSGAVFGSVCLLSTLVLLCIAPLVGLPLWGITLAFALVYAARNVAVYPFSTRSSSLNVSAGITSSASSTDAVPLSSAAAQSEVDTSVITMAPISKAPEQVPPASSRRNVCLCRVQRDE